MEDCHEKNNYDKKVHLRSAKSNKYLKIKEDQRGKRGTIRKSDINSNEHDFELIPADQENCEKVKKEEATNENSSGNNNNNSSKQKAYTTGLTVKHKEYISREIEEKMKTKITN